MALIKSILLSFSHWVLTALLNALLSGGWLSFFSTECNPWPGAYLLVFICTLVFSIPGIFIFWIVLLVNWDEDLLFRSLLKTGCIVAALTSLLLFVLPVDSIKGQQLFLSCCMLVASGASIMIHHSIIKSITPCKKNIQLIKKIN
ncbi:MAG: hypothetical protein H7Z13_01880 [Ferruginibacter sp.]|nr:hypothetical protein [Ferruginibacter sp.]